MRGVREIENDLAAKTKELNPLVVRYMDGGLDGDDLAQFRTLKGEVQDLQGELTDAKQTEQQRKDDLTFAQTAAGLHRHYNEPAGPSAARQAPRDANGNPTAPDRERQPAQSMGQQFVESQQFRSYREGGFHGDSARVSVDHLPAQQRALITSVTVTDTILPTRIPGILQPDLQELTLRDVLANGQTDSNLIEFVREGTRTNNAAETAEATTLTDGLKPESGFTLTPDSAPVRTIATLIYVTRQALDDMAGLRSYIDQLLARFIDERVNRQLLIGNGTTPNLRGLNSAVGLQNLNGAYFTTTMPNRADRIRRAIRLVREVGRGRASFIVLNPADVEYFDTLKVDGAAGQNEYALPGGGPFGTAGAPMTLWRRPVVEHEDQTAGIATVADGRAAMVMDRMDTQLYITDSNRDLFERNILTLLAETRLAFPIFFPSRIALTNLTATA